MNAKRGFRVCSLDNNRLRFFKHRPETVIERYSVAFAREVRCKTNLLRQDELVSIE